MSTDETPQPQMAGGGDDSPALVYWVYGLYLATLLTGVTAIIGVVIALVKRSEAAGSWVESHYQWQIRTFWFSLLGVIVAGLLAPFSVISGPLILVVAVWFIYRSAKGIIRAADNKPIENPTGWL